MKKKIVLLMIGCLILLTGCGNESTSKKTNNTNTSSNSNVPSTEEKVLNCKRSAEPMTGITAKLEYKVYYVGSYITTLHSVEEITTEDQEKLTQYKNAYEKAFAAYKNLKYYDNTVTQKGNTVKSETIIDYENIDTDKLLELEGEKDTVIKNGRVKVADWKEFAKKLGVSCS